ncbi:MAG: FtsX-like permease family protein [Clostridiales bacterium]|nr:FtsX-like permease family protein [Clostridiales bacterium]
MHTDNMEVEFEKYKFPESAVIHFNKYIWHKDGIVLKDDHTFLNLKDNEVILPLNHLTNICGGQLSEKDIMDKINNGLVIKQVKRVYNNETHEYDVSLSGVEYKVVGYSNNGGYGFASSEFSEEKLSLHGKYYVINDDDLSNAKEDYSHTSFTTFNEYFNNYCSGRTNATIENFLQSSFGAIYMKDGYNFYENGEFYKLKEDEVIISQDAIPGSFTSEDAEDLIKLANSGTTLELSINYGYTPITKLKVVGVVQSYGVFMVSEKVMNEKFLPLVEGFSYAVATLSDNSETNKTFIEYCERGDENGIKYIVQNDVTGILDEFQEIFNSITEVFFYVGIVFAVFSAFLLMNFISTSISYKKREIGVLRALGARSKDVFGIFFNESSLIAMINFFLATITTIITCGILNNMVVQKLGLNLIILSVGVRQIGLMFGISMVAAFIASLLPVVKISRKKPIDAINNR